jgi:hypothetical protein
MNAVRAITLALPSLVLVPLVFLSAKKDEAPAGCRFGVEYSLAASEKKLIDAVAAVSNERQAWGFWSDPGGLYGRAMTLRGEPMGPSVRVGERCAGGIHAQYHAGVGIYLACLTRATQSGVETGETADGGIVVRRLGNGLGIQTTVRFGIAGSTSQGIELAATRKDIWVVWHEGTGEKGQVWMARLDTGLKVLALKRISHPMNLAGEPSVLATGQSVWMAWTETWLRDEKLVYGVWIGNGQDAPRAVREQSFRDASPKLIDLGGRPLLAFRDRPERVRTAGLYTAWLADSGALVGSPVRVARADGEADPALRPCSGGLVIASPRTFGQEKFVGVNWLTVSLDRLSGEQQFAENARDFVLAGSTCVDDRTLLLIAERGSATQRYTNVRSVTYWCQ